jgi:hypothetical protein
MGIISRAAHMYKDIMSKLPKRWVGMGGFFHLAKIANPIMCNPDRVKSLCTGTAIDTCDYGRINCSNLYGKQPLLASLL